MPKSAPRVSLDRLSTLKCAAVTLWCGAVLVGASAAVAQSASTGRQGPSCTLMIQLQVGEVGGVGPDEVVGIDDGPVGPIFGFNGPGVCRYVVNTKSYSFGTILAGKPLADLGPLAMVTIPITANCASSVSTDPEFPVVKITRKSSALVADANGTASIPYTATVGGVVVLQPNVQRTFNARTRTIINNGLATPKFTYLFDYGTIDIALTGTAPGVLGRYSADIEYLVEY